MAHKTMVNSTAYEISGGKDLVDGTAYSIKGGKTLVDGTGYEIGFGTPIGDLAVGSSVYMNVDGVATEFLVIHQGLPDATLYDDSCDGTWLLMKDIYTTRAYGASGYNGYNESTIHTYLNDTFVNLFDSDIKSQIKQVKIPYSTGDANNLITGSDGVLAQIFLLSCIEVGSSLTDANVEGAVLDYFDGASDSIRVAYYNGSASHWWLRSPREAYNYKSNCMVYPAGNVGSGTCTYARGVRPALILPPETMVDSSFNVIA